MTSQNSVLLLLSSILKLPISLLVLGAKATVWLFLFSLSCGFVYYSHWFVQWNTSQVCRHLFWLPQPLVSASSCMYYAMWSCSFSKWSFFFLEGVSVAYVLCCHTIAFGRQRSCRAWLCNLWNKMCYLCLINLVVLLNM